MVDTPDVILLASAEIHAEAKVLLDTLTVIPLYDSEKRKLCIAKHIDKIQRIIAGRILQCGDDNRDIQSSVIVDLLQPAL